jgi:hypothetical protein
MKMQIDKGKSKLEIKDKLDEIVEILHGNPKSKKCLTQEIYGKFTGLRK